MNPDIPQPPLAVQKIKRKPSAGTGVESIIGPGRSVQLRHSHSSLFNPESTVASTVDPRQSPAPGSPSPVTRIQTLRLMQSFGSYSSQSDGRNGPSPVGSGHSSRHHRIRVGGIETTSPEPISDGGDRGDCDGDSVDRVHPVSPESTSEPHYTEDFGHARGPTIRIADSVTTQHRAGEDVGVGDRVMVRHVDSGVRLTVGGLNLPVELPPVYSSN